MDDETVGTLTEAAQRLGGKSVEISMTEAKENASKRGRQS
jgi:hypothetical protein